LSEVSFADTTDRNSPCFNHNNRKEEGSWHAVRNISERGNMWNLLNVLSYLAVVLSR